MEHFLYKAGAKPFPGIGFNVVRRSLKKGEYYFAFAQPMSEESKSKFANLIGHDKYAVRYNKVTGGITGEATLVEIRIK